MSAIILGGSASAPVKTRLTLMSQALRREFLESIMRGIFVPRVDALRAHASKTAQAINDRYHAEFYKILNNEATAKYLSSSRSASAKFKFKTAKQDDEKRSPSGLYVPILSYGVKRADPAVQMILHKDRYRSGCDVTVNGPTTGAYESDGLYCRLSANEQRAIEKIEREADKLSAEFDAVVSDVRNALAACKTVTAFYQVAPKLRQFCKVSETYVSESRALVMTTEQVMSNIEKFGLLPVKDVEGAKPAENDDDEWGEPISVAA